MTDSFSNRLRQGEKLYGTLIVSSSPRWPEQIAKLGLDFVFIDTEHIALDRSELSWMCQTYKALGMYPIVRILSPDPFLATAALDGGACGIVAPYVETADQARELMGAVKLRPIKGKKLKQLLDKSETASDHLQDYMQEGSKENSLILNIESIEGMQNLDKILEVEGVDGVLIGPHDLSSSLEIPEDYRHPEFNKAVCKIIQTARAKHRGAGIHAIMGARGLDLESGWIEAGANFILHSADIIAAMDSLHSEFNTLKSGVHKGSENQADSTDPINI
ncbi:aldolase/citrate lyase family protein [bacterium]|jgi:4-hydroxy-2-oxoheptanedioate aldolase|nr:aldolase/citrate lyase family protein [bacterium]